MDYLWRHPFTAEDPLVSKWCKAECLQICSDEETNSSTSCIRRVNLQQSFIFGWTIPLKNKSLYSGHFSDFFFWKEFHALVHHLKREQISAVTSHDPHDNDHLPACLDPMQRLSAVMHPLKKNKKTKPMPLTWFFQTTTNRVWQEMWFSLTFCSRLMGCELCRSRYSHSCCGPVYVVDRFMQHFKNIFI